MPRLPAVLKGVPSPKFPKWCMTVAETASVASTVRRHRPCRPHGQDDAAASESNRCPPCFLSHVQHEAVIRGSNVSSWV